MPAISPIVCRLAAAAQLARRLRPEAIGHVHAITGLAIDVVGLGGFARAGSRVRIAAEAAIEAEFTGFHDGLCRLMPLGRVTGVGPGASVLAPVPLGAGPAQAALPVHDQWLGRVVDPLGRPLDGKGSLPQGPPRAVRAEPPPAASRARLGPRMPFGVHALDLFVPCRTGQRLGLFAGSGVGKSTLLAMLAQRARCETVVLALIGERGREVREFIEDHLGPGLARCVVVVATSDQPALLRREAAYAALTIAEHFRDQGRTVLLLMDSVTRFCLALREIGLANGEPPATRGYPPSMFAELPCLLERAGPGEKLADGGEAGSITGLFTVLVEGDDHNEPVADAVRGILDGHVVLDRRIAERGRFPAMDPLRSLSRTAPGCLEPHEAEDAREARAILAQHAELADLVRLGAYQHGTDPASDRALRLAPAIERLIQQGRGADGPETDPFAALAHLLATAAEPPHAE